MQHIMHAHGIHIHCMHLPTSYIQQCGPPSGVVTILVVMLTRGEGAGYSVSTTFVIFVSVVPIGMPVVTAAVLAIGAREMVREKAIVTRLSALEELSGLEILASDKTGTLTLNKYVVFGVLTWGCCSWYILACILEQHAFIIPCAYTNTCPAHFPCTPLQAHIGQGGNHNVGQQHT